ncbi:MAG: carbohydrate ABC transporter permease [Candidatus Caldatribacteriaceae bacterium]
MPRRTFLGEVGKWSYILPALFILGLVLLTPLFFAFWMSFQHMPIGRPATFVGVKNFIRILQDPLFYQSLQRTLYYAFPAVGIKAVIGLLVALFLNRKFWGRGILRGIAIIPYALPLFIVCVLFWFVYDYRGIGNFILRTMGLQPIHWLSYQYAMPSIILVNVWHGWPFFYLGFLAGLQSIPTELYESAEIDGASSFDQFLYITLPLLAPVFWIVCGLSLMWTMGDFVTPKMMTGGGPADVTLTIPIATYKIAFLLGLNYPLASAYAVTILPIFVVLIYLTVKKLG